MFDPDSALVANVHPSPNVGERKRGLHPSILLLHYTGLETVERSIDVLSRPDCAVSCHYVVDEAGRITQMVPESLRAWHAGQAYWAGETDINSASIGIEIQNPGHELGYPDFPEHQMCAVEALAGDIVARHRIIPARVLAHSDVAPVRKRDPGEKFDWARLARSGIGHWLAPAPLGERDEAFDPREHVKACAVTVAEAQELLAEYGYEISVSGVYDRQTEFVVRAFQRHFRPARCDGKIDASTLKTLRALVESVEQSSMA